MRGEGNAACREEKRGFGGKARRKKNHFGDRCKRKIILK
jgi:hypothetical protein